VGEAAKKKRKQKPLKNKRFRSGFDELVENFPESAKNSVDGSDEKRYKA